MALYRWGAENTSPKEGSEQKSPQVLSFLISLLHDLYSVQGLSCPKFDIANLSVIYLSQVSLLSLSIAFF